MAPISVNKKQAARFRFLSGKKALLLLIVVFCMLITLMPASCQKDERLEISFLDVGQGDAVLVSQGNTQILIDGGPSPQALMRELSSKMSYFDRTIEVVVLTHAHADHINGLLEVLRRYNVLHVIYPAEDDDLAGYESLAYQEWLTLIEEKQIPSTIAQEGMAFSMGEAVFTVLNPPNNLYKGTASDIDNNSIVLELVAGKYSFLFTGDLMWQGEMELVLNRKIKPVNILKVAHHGSKTSSSLEFLSVIRPNVAIICVGENNFGHPDGNVVERILSFTGDGAIFRTDDCSGVSFLTDGDSLWMKTGNNYWEG